MKKQNKRAKKVNHGGFDFSWHAFDHALTAMEKQAEWAYRQFKHTLPKPWEKKLNELDTKEIFGLALKKRKQITKEVKYYTDGIVHTLSNADFLSNKNHLVKEAKHNLENFLHKIQKSGVVTHAKDLAASKGTKVLERLNFPTKKDVVKLNSRLSQLEKRLKDLGSSKAKHYS